MDKKDKKKEDRLSLETNKRDDPKSEPNSEELEKVKKEVEEYKEKYLRLAAEFDNYKKRQSRIFDEMVSASQDALLHRILGILDNFERALESTKGEVSKESVIEGVELIYKQLQDLLEAEKITEICPTGEAFDPNVHEAVSVIPCDEDEKIVEVIQKGYKRGERLVRPAKVVVGKSHKTEETEES